MTETRTIRWVVAHEPVDLFLRTAEAFAKEIEETSKGRIKIEILTADDYYNMYHQGTKPELPIQELFNSLSDGKFEMFQTTVGWYGMINNHFLALDLPFLFRDHDHASRVLEGPIGRALCDSLQMRSNVKGLAFTYSGGYRVIGTKEPITSLKDLKGKRVKVGTNPLCYITMEKLGAIPKTSAPVVGGNVDLDFVDGETIDAAETTYLRFRGDHVLKTGHSLFLTTISINKDFWNSLDAETQDLMSKAAVAAAKIERQWSIDDAVKYETEADLNGITIVDISEEEQQQLKALTESVYEETESWFTPGFVNAIRTH